MCNKNKTTEPIPQISAETGCEAVSQIELNNDADSTMPQPDNKHCLNCNTELKGEYCYSCGQHVSAHTLTVKQFLLNYLDNAFWWDNQHFKTLWLLMTRPGYLTKEYIAGKTMNQVQPLKLNMFLLFIFITLFVSFASPEKMNTSVNNFVNSELFFSALQMEAIANDSEYQEKLQSSKLDTVKLLAPLFLTENYSNLLTCDKVIYDSKGKDMDKWVAIVPHMLIEEKIIKADESGIYHFNTQENKMEKKIAIFKSIGEQLADLTLTHFPMLILLTAPFLSVSLLIVQRERKHPFLTHFIFSLHYIAFLELIFIFTYLLFLIVNPPMELLNYIFIFSSCLYFTLSFRMVYNTTWVRSVTKAMFSCGIYYAICLLVFTIVFFIACIIVANKI